MSVRCLTGRLLVITKLVIPKCEAHFSYENSEGLMKDITPSRQNGRLSIIHIIGLLFAFGVAVTIAIGVLDNRKKEQVEKEAQRVQLAKIAALVKTYYGQGEIKAGTFGSWKVVNVQARSDNPFSDKINIVEVRLAVSDRIFQDMQQRSPEGRFRAASNGCPPVGHEIYGLLTNNDNLTLQLEVGGTVFIDVDCARWAGNIGRKA